MCYICGNSADFYILSMIWYCRIQSTAVSKERDVWWCGFRYSIPLSIGYVWSSCIDMDISTTSCSYCIWNRYCQNHRSILPNFLLFAWFYLFELNRRQWSNNKMYDNMVFNDRFWYQLTMFEVCIITTGNLLHAGNDLSCRTVV